jgi:hypothetical protein
MKLLKWLGTAIEDKAGGISSKRLGFFWCLWMLSRAVTTPEVNEIVIWAIVGLAFGLVGLTVPEWYSKLNANKPE